jgi:hypothetical protein
MSIAVSASNPSVVAKIREYAPRQAGYPDASLLDASNPKNSKKETHVLAAEVLAMIIRAELKFSPSVSPHLICSRTVAAHKEKPYTVTVNNRRFTLNELHACRRDHELMGMIVCEDDSVIHPVAKIPTKLFTG